MLQKCLFLLLHGKPFFTDKKCSKRLEVPNTLIQSSPSFHGSTMMHGEMGLEAHKPEIYSWSNTLHPWEKRRARESRGEEKKWEKSNQLRTMLWREWNSMHFPNRRSSAGSFFEDKLCGARVKRWNNQLDWLHHLVKVAIIKGNLKRGESKNRKKHVSLQDQGVIMARGIQCDPRKSWKSSGDPVSPKWVSWAGSRSGSNFT